MNSLFKSIIFLILFLGHFQNVKSQTFFETAFKDNSGTSYKGFMVYYSEDNCYMRLAFEKGEEYHIVQIDFEASTGITDDSVHYFLLLGKKSEFVSFNTENLVHLPEHFIWLWEKSDSTQKPFFTNSVSADFSNSKEVEYFKKVEISKINELYIDQFFISSDPDYQSFIDALNHPEVDYSTYFNANKKPCLHLIVVANTQIGDIGQSCLVDKRCMISEFNGVADVLKIDYKEYIVDDKQFCKKNLMQIIDTIRPGQDDIVIFLYTGHGFRWDNQSDKYPFLDLRENLYKPLNAETTIALSEVYNKLSSKNARLTLVMGDCCNSNVGANQLSSSNFLSTMALSNYRKENLINLMLKSSGSIISCASSPGEYSWCNNSNGGFYTLSFIQSFKQEIGILNTKNSDWKNIMQNTLYNAKIKTSSQLCPDCDVQNGLMFSKIVKKN